MFKRKRTLATYVTIGATLIILAIIFRILGLDRDPSFFEWPVLYFGSAVVQAYAALIAVPFTIWVIYMQSKYGTVIVRMFLNKIIYPFTIFAIVAVVSACTMSLEKTEYAYWAFMAELAVTLIFLPPLISYIIKLMTMGPEDVISTLKASSRSLEDFIATSLHILRLYMLEAYPDEKAISSMLRTILFSMRNIERLKLYPEVWHKFKDLLKAIAVEGAYLPNKYLMKNLMALFMAWLVRNNRDRTARAFIRYYKRVALRYMEERLPSEIVEDLFLDPTLGVFKVLNAKKSLVAYATDQCISLLKKIRRANMLGDITSKEMCRVLTIVDRYFYDVEELAEVLTLRKYISRMRKELMCAPKH
ncbi:MAG: hypothetical protein B6U76_05380 [Desulfurococcales archaeon ex4484_217_2]|nr:MAG: hypothetical protein B6U76_05380 [Desulfurococcales archaeon ex4484_217_2]